jgi:hypothetical protein
MSNDPHFTTRVPFSVWNAWEVKKQPETLEEVVLVLKALIACGLTFHADDPKVEAEMDSNPMLERT